MNSLINDDSSYKTMEEFVVSGGICEVVHCPTLQDIKDHLQPVQELLPSLSEQVKSFLFDSSREVLQLQETFSTAVAQQEEIDHKLKEYMERVDSWERLAWPSQWSHHVALVE